MYILLLKNYNTIKVMIMISSFVLIKMRDISRCSRKSACLWRWREPSDLPEMLHLHFSGVVWRLLFGLAFCCEGPCFVGIHEQMKKQSGYFSPYQLQCTWLKLKLHKFLSPAALAISGFSPLLYFDLFDRCLKFWWFFMSWILCNQLRCKSSISLANI